MRFALAHAEQASLDYLEAVGLQVGQEEEPPILRGRQGTVLVHGKPTRSPGFPIEAPRRHVGLKRGRKRRDQLLKLLERETG